MTARIMEERTVENKLYWHDTINLQYLLDIIFEAKGHLYTYPLQDRGEYAKRCEYVVDLPCHLVKFRTSSFDYKLNLASAVLRDYTAEDVHAIFSTVGELEPYIEQIESDKWVSESTKQGLLRIPSELERVSITFTLPECLPMEVLLPDSEVAANTQ